MFLVIIFGWISKWINDKFDEYKFVVVFKYFIFKKEKKNVFFIVGCRNLKRKE